MILQKIIYKLANWLIRYTRTHELYITKSKLNSFGANLKIIHPFIMYNHKYISIGDNFSALYNLRLEAFDEYYGTRFFPEINIGNNVSMNSDCHIGCIKKVFIGDNVLIASRVYISDHSHGNISVDDIDIPPYLRPLFSKGPVVIEDNVWIGEGVCILSGVTIGRNTIIGANSVVNKSIPSNCVAAGIPAKVIKVL